MLINSMIAMPMPMNGYKWTCKMLYVATIIVTLLDWFLVVYFPTWRKPRAFVNWEIKK